MSDLYWNQRFSNENQNREQDSRNQWERDYARIIHSSAFRRLQSKTQIYSLGESDFYRTRLTHSLEVSQVGLGITKHLESQNIGRLECQNLLPDPFLIQAICLAHDLGHPPYGHGGEISLNLLMRDHGGFEGNGQTLKILSKLDKYTDGFGIDPTRRLLLGVLKYPRPYSEVVNVEAYQSKEKLKNSWLFERDLQKPAKCYLDDEKPVIDWVLDDLSESDKAKFTVTESKQKSHKKTLRKALDTSIMELADDISYGLHDMEDAISLKVITLSFWNEYFEEGQRYKKFEACGLDFNERSKALFSSQAFERKRAIGDMIHSMITHIHLEHIPLSQKDNFIFDFNAVMEAPFKALLEEFKALVYNHVIKSENVQLLELKGQKMLVDVFEVLATDPKRFLPERTFEGVAEDQKLRTICDYVAGMTDQYLVRLYEKIFTPNKGSLFDQMYGIGI